MPFFQKKPVVIEAIQYTGMNVDEIKSFVKNDCAMNYAGQLQIFTLEDGQNGEAKHIADKNDWIIKGVEGEFYPCKPSIFDKTYEPLIKKSN